MFHIADNSKTTSYERLTNQASDKPFPCEDEVRQLGINIVTEVLDTFGKDATEDHASMIANCVIGGIHSAIMRIERETDFAVNELKTLQRDQDGSEINSNQIEDTLAKVRLGEAITTALETFRDGAADSYFVTTGDVWKPYRGSQRSSTTTFAIIETQEVLRLRAAKKNAAVPEDAQVVIFRAHTDCDAKQDQERIFQWLDRAKERFPNMHLACSNNRGGEKMAMSWAKINKVPVYQDNLKAADGKTAPFKLNDRLLSLKPVMVISMPKSLTADESFEGSGIVKNIADKAHKMGITTYHLGSVQSSSKAA